MSAGTSPGTSVVIVTYNSAAHIVDCLNALLQSGFDILLEVIVYDNASGDGTQALIRNRFPGVKLVEGPANSGFAAACNRGAELAQGEYLAFLNPDTMVEPGWLSALIAVLESDPAAGAATPQLIFADRPGVVNACGNEVHFSGITYCREFGSPVSGSSPVEVGAISGAAFVIRKRLFQELGGFEPIFFLYFEDTDLSLRIRCAGLKCMAAYGSRVRHAYRPSFDSAKIFYLERNRYLALLSLLAWPLLVLMLPSLALMELVSWVYCLRQGRPAMAAKMRSWQDLFRKRRWIAARRRQERSCCSDKRWATGAFSARLQIQYVDSQSRALAGLLEMVAWLLAKPMLCVAQAIWG